MASVEPEERHALPGNVEQLRQLYQLTQALARAGDVDEIRAVVLTAARAQLGARAGWWVTNDDGSADEVVDESLVVRDVLRDGEPRFWESRDELARAYPALAHIPTHALAVVPMRAGGGVVGAVGFSFLSPRGFDADDRALVRAFADEAGHALVRTRACLELHGAIIARDHVLAMIGHDLRDPVHAIALAVHRLEDEADRGPAPREVVLAISRRISAAILRITRLVREVIDAIAIDASGGPALERQPTDLIALARCAVDEHGRAVHPRHRIVLKHDRDRVVGNWDPDRLGEVLDHLLSNAVKYSPDGGEVTVRVGVSDGDSAPDALLIVTDGGLGIPAGEVVRVFDRFYRARNAAGLRGLGIGLSIVRRIIEQHGGSVHAVSREGAGTTVIVRLPR